MAQLKDLIVTGDSSIVGNESVCGNANITGVTTSTGGFVGNLTGTASRATGDKDGNQIDTTYLKKSGGTMTGEFISPKNNFITSGNEFDFVPSSYSKSNIHFN